ncbi:hypothetical protein EC957_011708, partial [Mortierella hygrophila]
KPPGQATRERFTKQDMEFILTWMEHRPNFESVFGCGGQTIVGTPQKTKTQGYSTLAQLVSKQSKGRLNINGKAMRERFQRHMKVFTDVKRKADSTGFGVTEEDNRSGIYTVTHKLESMCTCYARMDELFGNRANITPMSEFASVVVTGQEQEECEEARTAPQRRRRQIVDDGEEDTEEEEYGSNTENGHIDDILGDNIDNNFFDTTADSQEDSARENRPNAGNDINDGTDAIDCDEISLLMP